MSLSYFDGIEWCYMINNKRLNILPMNSSCHLKIYINVHNLKRKSHQNKLSSMFKCFKFECMWFNFVFLHYIACNKQAQATCAISQASIQSLNICAQPHIFVYDVHQPCESDSSAFIWMPMSNEMIWKCETENKKISHDLLPIIIRKITIMIRFISSSTSFACY